MTRLDIYNEVKKVCTTYSVGQHNGECISTYAVLKFDFQDKSTNNRGAGWQTFQVMVYVPKTSIVGIDATLTSIREKLIAIGVEETGKITPDYIDEEKKAIMRSEYYNIPKQI